MGRGPALGNTGGPPEPVASHGAGADRLSPTGRPRRGGATALYKYSPLGEAHCSVGVRVLWQRHSLDFQGGSDGRERIRGSRPHQPSLPPPSALCSPPDSSAARCRFLGDPAPAPAAAAPARPRGSVCLLLGAFHQRSREEAAANKRKQEGSFRRQEQQQQPVR